MGSGVVVDLGPTVLEVVEFECQGASVGEVATQHEGEGVGTDLRDVDDGAVEVADVTAFTRLDNGVEIGDPGVGSRVGSIEGVARGDAALPVVARVGVVAGGGVPVVDGAVKVVLNVESDDVETIVLIDQRVVGAVGIALELRPYGEGSGTVGEDEGGNGDKSGGAGLQVTRPSNRAVEDTLLGIEAIVEVGCGDGISALVGNAEGDGVRLVVADEVVARRNNLSDGHVGGRRLSVDKNAEVDDVGIVVHRRRDGLSIVGHHDTHPHVAERGIGGDGDGGLEGFVKIEGGGGDDVLSRLGKVAATVEIDIDGSLAAETLGGGIEGSQLDDDGILQATGHVDGRIFGIIVGGHVVVATSKRRHIKVYLIEGETCDIKSQVGGIGRAILALGKGLEGVVVAEGVVTVRLVSGHLGPDNQGVVLLGLGGGDAVEQCGEGVGVDLVLLDGGGAGLGDLLNDVVAFLELIGDGDVAQRRGAVVGNPHANGVVLHVDTVAQRSEDVDHRHIVGDGVFHMHRHLAEIAGAVLGGETVEVVGRVVEILWCVVPESGSGITVGVVEGVVDSGIPVPTDRTLVDLRGTDGTPGGIGDGGIIAHRRFGSVEGLGDGPLGGDISRVVGRLEVVFIMAPAGDTHFDILCMSGGIHIDVGVEVEGDGGISVERGGQRGSFPDRGSRQRGHRQVGRRSDRCLIAYLETRSGRDGLLTLVLEGDTDNDITLLAGTAGGHGGEHLGGSDVEGGFQEDGGNELVVVGSFILAVGEDNDMHPLSVHYSERCREVGRIGLALACREVVQVARGGVCLFLIALEVGIPADVLLGRVAVVAELGLHEHLVGLDVQGIAQHRIDNLYNRHIVGSLLHLVGTDGGSQGGVTLCSVDVVGHLAVILTLVGEVGHQQVEVGGRDKVGLLELRVGIVGVGRLQTGEADDGVHLPDEGLVAGGVVGIVVRRRNGVELGDIVGVALAKVGEDVVLHLDIGIGVTREESVGLVVVGSRILAAIDTHSVEEHIDGCAGTVNPDTTGFEGAGCHTGGTGTRATDHIVDNKGGMVEGAGNMLQQDTRLTAGFVVNKIYLVLLHRDGTRGVGEVDSRQSTSGSGNS